MKFDPEDYRFIEAADQILARTTLDEQLVALRAFMTSALKAGFPPGEADALVNWIAICVFSIQFKTLPPDDSQN
jgi:hypothetical protein